MSCRAAAARASADLAWKRVNRPLGQGENDPSTLYGAPP